MQRRHFLAIALVAPALAVGLAACGDDSPPAGSTATTVPSSPVPTTYAYPAGADDVVVRIGFEGGFVAPGTDFVRLPTMLISGDGRVFTPAPVREIFPGPLVAPVNVRSITPAGIQAILAAADAAGLLATPPTYSNDVGVTDMPDTVIDIAANGATFHHQAYALGFETETDVARTALAGFAAALGDLESTAGIAELGDDSLFDPTAYRFFATPVDLADYEGSEPAPSLLDWPTSSSVVLASSTTCAIATSDAVGEIFTSADELTFFTEGDVIYRLSVAAVLPGDPGC